MATSYNGYEVIANYGDSRLTKLAANGHLFAPNPGILAGPVAVVMNYLADFLDREVEPIDLSQQLDDWAFQPKIVTGGSGWSCHASGTAFDYNALNHPQGVDNTWTVAQKSKIDNFLYNVLESSVRWGEHYTYPTKRDGMHYEVMAPINVMIRIADKVTGLGTIKPPPVTIPDWVFTMTAAQQDAFAQKIAAAVWDHPVGNGQAGPTLEEIRKTNRDHSAQLAVLLDPRNGNVNGTK